MIRIDYVTSSDYKTEENDTLQKVCTLPNGSRVSEAFEFKIRQVSIKESLEVDLKTLVSAEVTKAYSQLKVPCVVEHAGLVFDDHEERGYPGGLTKPMWNVLGDHFIEETRSAGRRAIARAVVAYCDGKTVETFVGNTRGRIADEARGSRDFYWDTVFIPDTEDSLDLTYAEIVGRNDLGLEFKVRELSQSTKAMLAFLEHRLANKPSLWPTRTQ